MLSTLYFLEKFLGLKVSGILGINSEVEVQTGKDVVSVRQWDSSESSSSVGRWCGGGHSADSLQAVEDHYKRLFREQNQDWGFRSQWGSSCRPSELSSAPPHTSTLWEHTEQLSCQSTLFIDKLLCILQVWLQLWPLHDSFQTGALRLNNFQRLPLSSVDVFMSDILDMKSFSGSYILQKIYWSQWKHKHQTVPDWWKITKKWRIINKGQW